MFPYPVDSIAMCSILEITTFVLHKAMPLHMHCQPVRGSTPVVALRKSFIFIRMDEEGSS